MRCWCARCKVLVPVVHLERWVTGESGEGIVRGACAICGLPTGEIGVYAAPAAQRRSVHALPERVRVAPSRHGRLRARHDTNGCGRHRRDEQQRRDGVASRRDAVRIIAAPADDPLRMDAEHRVGAGGHDLLPVGVQGRGLAADLDPARLPS
jgi:hypothetical protein